MDVQFINPFLEGTKNVLETMAMVQPQVGKPYLKKGNQAKGDVSAIIGMTGSAHGSLALSFSEKCILKIEEQQNDKIVIDGLRSYVEAESFVEHFSNFTLITVHSSPQTRFERLSARGRSDDPKTWEVFHARDLRELSVGIGNAIALAEYVIINNSVFPHGHVPAGYFDACLKLAAA